MTAPEGLWAGDVFAYGSLMFARVWEKVTGEARPGQPAWLADYAARALCGQSYPALVPERGACTQGVLYEAVSPEALARLDAFEGGFYERVELRVLRPAGLAGRAWVYVAACPEAPEILAEAWDAGRFAREALEAFLRADPGFSQGGGG
jgi:gamma-glutamylcyclotransferase (GGCT)/AIG2-like uncharacterized protein YtfP